MLRCFSHNVSTKSSGRLQFVVRQFARHSTNDSFKVAIILNIVVSTQEYIGELAKAVMNGPDEEFILEALGILGNLTVANVNFQALLTDYDMLNYIKTKLQPGEWKVLYHLPWNVINWEGRGWGMDSKACTSYGE